MSLNGLDDAKVKEAHDAALAEPGRWYVLLLTPCGRTEMRTRVYLFSQFRVPSPTQICVHGPASRVLLTGSDAPS